MRGSAAPSCAPTAAASAGVLPHQCTQKYHGRPQVVQGLSEKRLTAALTQVSPLDSMLEAHALHEHCHTLCVSRVARRRLDRGTRCACDELAARHRALGRQVLHNGAAAGGGAADARDDRVRGRGRRDGGRAGHGRRDRQADLRFDGPRHRARHRSRRRIPGSCSASSRQARCSTCSARWTTAGATCAPSSSGATASTSPGPSSIIWSAVWSLGCTGSWHRRRRGTLRMTSIGMSGTSDGTIRVADVAAAAQLACLLEAAAPKPGNVSPGCHFADARYEDFLASAAAIGAPLSGAGTRPVGATVRLAIEATAQWIRSNTNLGMVLLRSPLPRAALLGSPSAGKGTAPVFPSPRVGLRRAAPGGRDDVRDRRAGARPGASRRTVLGRCGRRNVPDRARPCGRHARRPPRRRCRGGRVPRSRWAAFARRSGGAQSTRWIVTCAMRATPPTRVPLRT